MDDRCHHRHACRLCEKVLIVNGRLAVCSNSIFYRKVEDEDTLAEISEVISETSEYFDESSADFYASWAFLVTYDMVAAFNNISQSGEVSRVKFGMSGQF